jgi:hypothetical protein
MYLKPKTNLLVNITFLLVVTIIAACTRNNNAEPKPEIAPIQKTESQSVYYYRTTDNGFSTSYEHGITFSSNMNGKITKVGGKVPKTGNYRITVWDDSSKAVIKTAYADLDSVSYKYVNITPINVPANKRFVVSINVLKEAFVIRDNTGINFMPYFLDGITIHYCSDAKTSTQTFPDRQSYFFKLNGLVDFIFVAD